MKRITIILLLALILGCKSNTNRSDAYGNFEAEESLISAETGGKIILMNRSKGDLVNIGDVLAIIDTTQLHLQKQSLLSQQETILSQKNGIETQVDILLAERENLVRDQERYQNLLDTKAIPQKQKDDIDGIINVMDKKIANIRSQTITLDKNLQTQQIQLQISNDKLYRCYITAPISGTILENYHELGEFVSVGKPLFKIAKIDELILNAYVSETQLSEFSLGQSVSVFTDKADNQLTKHPGKIIYVSPQAEFTPKIVQTSDQRTSLVYRIEISVVNDGSLKIGMPGEVRW